jgi:hypothetical protein
LGETEENHKFQLRQEVSGMKLELENFSIINRRAKHLNPMFEE